MRILAQHGKLCWVTLCLEIPYDRVQHASAPRVTPKEGNHPYIKEGLHVHYYQCVNIALVNELKMLSLRMGIDIWEVIAAAKTKPFGFQPFYPGPGLGGHCIPVDPFYLSWKAKEFDFQTRFIELAGEVNTNMPYHVVTAVRDALNDRRKSLKGSKALVLGVAYKKDIDEGRSRWRAPFALRCRGAGGGKPLR